MSRLDLIRDAQRPKMCARAMFQGPQGSGKTWTTLSIARLLTGDTGQTYLYDTERESSLTYADVFRFKHLPWRPPYDPGELTGTLDEHARTLGPDDVVIIDSFSHFWQGTGGILDIANGRVQGGWDKARPIQNHLVEQLLAMPCHLLLCARMKNSVLVSDNGKTIENVGLTIIQDDALAYELNIVLQLDMQHGATVLKSRTPAVPVGRLYPGGSEGKLAADYARWLAGGIPPANREDVEAIVQVFAGITDAVARKALKDGFVASFGMPHSLTAEQVAEARQWLTDNGAPIGEGPAAGGGMGETTAAAAAEVLVSAVSTLVWALGSPLVPTDGPGLPPQEAPAAVTAPEPGESAPDQPEASEAPVAPDGIQRAHAVGAYVRGLDKPALVKHLNEVKASTAGKLEVLQDRLILELVGSDFQPPQQALV